MSHEDGAPTGEGTVGVILDGDLATAGAIEKEARSVIDPVQNDVWHVNVLALREAGYKNPYPISFAGYNPNDPKIGTAWVKLKEAWDKTAKQYPHGLTCQDYAFVLPSSIPISAAMAGSRQDYERALSKPVPDSPAPEPK